MQYYSAFGCDLSNLSQCRLKYNYIAYCINYQAVVCLDSWMLQNPNPYNPECLKQLTQSENNNNTTKPDPEVSKILDIVRVVG